MARALVGAALLMPLLMPLAWLSGRLLGGRPPWWLAPLSAAAGPVAGDALAASIALFLRVIVLVGRGQG